MLVSKALQRGHIRAHYQENFVPLPMQEHNQGRRVLIHREELKRFNDTFKKRHTHFGLQYLYRQIWSLKNSGLLNSLFHESAPLSKLLMFEGGSICYAAMDGDIYIEKITVTGRLGVNAKHPAGVYKVRKQEESDHKWLPDIKNMFIEERGFIDCKNMAISGYAANLESAAGYMPKFIRHGFGETSLSNVYALFYSPPQGRVSGAYKALRDSLGGKELESAKKLATVLEQIAIKQQTLNITVHGYGHYVFKSALKKINARNLKLPNVTVYYANATANLSAVDTLRRKTQMTLTEKAPLINPASLQQKYFSGNFISAPEIAIRAKPGNAISIIVNGLSSLPFSASGSLIGFLAVGSHRQMESELIENNGQAVQSTAKLVWNSIHKIMVRS